MCNRQDGMEWMKKARVSVECVKPAKAGNSGPLSDAWVGVQVS